MTMVQGIRATGKRSMGLRDGTMEVCQHNQRLENLLDKLKFSSDQ